MFAFQTATQRPDGATYHQRSTILRVYVIYFPMHCADVINISSGDSPSPAVKRCGIAEINLRDVAAPGKKRLPICSVFYLSAQFLLRSRQQSAEINLTCILPIRVEQADLRNW